jgi:hypothetical protein
MEVNRPIVDAIHDSGSSHRTGQPARLTRRRTPIRSAISRSFARLAAKKRPTKRSPRSFSIPCCQRWALKPSRSKIPASSSEIEAFPWRKSRPVYSTRFDQRFVIDDRHAPEPPFEKSAPGFVLPVGQPREWFLHSATRSDTSVPQTHPPIWIGRSPSRKSPGGVTLLYAIPVASSRSRSLLVVENHHRDWSSQHRPRARVAECECACPFNCSAVCGALPPTRSFRARGLARTLAVITADGS